MEWFDYLSSEAAHAGAEQKRERIRSREERFLPAPNVVHCSQCGGEFHRYLEWTGYSHCEDHTAGRSGDLSGIPRQSIDSRGVE